MTAIRNDVVYKTTTVGTVDGVKPWRGSFRLAFSLPVYPLSSGTTHGWCASPLADSLRGTNCGPLPWAPIPFL